MDKGRMEAFSDGVIAVIITIMVLEMKAPLGAHLRDLQSLLPVFVSYVLSYIYIGIYWSNHHHLLHAAERVSGAVLWANLHLLFWLSLVPLATAWMGNTRFQRWPVVLYGGVLLGAALAYSLLVQTLLRIHARHSVLAEAIGCDRKGNVSLVLYAIAILAAFWSSWAGCAGYALVAAVWLVPDRRIEKKLIA
jgi:uncharacterized membrane protein